MLREIHKTERKQQILSAARRLIRKKGFPRMSMRELAQEARVSLATPYNLFGSKANVLYALLESLFEKLENAIDVALHAARQPVPVVACDSIGERRDLKIILDVDRQRVDDRQNVRRSTSAHATAISVAGSRVASH